MAKVGRPRIEIDKKQFESLCGLQCSLDEIADFFECSSDTIERWCKREYEKNFAETFAIKRGKGKISLRRAQFELAKHNAAMAIFLGKQYLGQKDYPNDRGDGGEVKVIIDV
jgi:hypothetical protein